MSPSHPSEPGDDTYDARSKPARGVHIDPLPRAYHRRFAAFLAQCDRMAQSHLSTWKLANREGIDGPVIQSNLIYWSAFRKALNTLEYLGMRNDPAKRRRTPGGGGR